jgi:uncharacterized protein (DUF1697 family)
VARVASASRHVLLLRGVNVGGHKRVPMADLRRMLEQLGHANVRTLLNSGNAVFDVARASRVTQLTLTIETAIEKMFGFTSRSFVLPAALLDVVVRENPLMDRVDNPSRLLVAFLASAADRERLAPIEAQEWGTDAFATGSHAAYLWCRGGILESALPEAVGRVLRGDVTTRNWATVLKLQALCVEE